MTARTKPPNPDIDHGPANQAAPQNGNVPGDALDNAIARARARGAKHIEEILGSPQMIGSEEFGRLLGVTPQAVGKWRRKGLVLGLKSRMRIFRYPRWQITEDGRPLPGLKEIADELGSAWIVYRFLLQNHPELRGKTALECLKAGQIDDVVGTARAIAQGSFS